ncbi:MAG TPA: peptide ABC transporter substrate-binding protein [Candidatus Bathyarchaeia archaeon]|nr:peptide ABC transporter substrate-binding protein [Candidatus Bathyarchaeia archaeon]
MRALATLSLIALAACVPQQTDATRSSPTTAAGALVSQRGAGGDLKILYWQPPSTLNTHQATGPKDSDAARLVLEPLASLGKDGQPIANGLAAEIPTIANGGIAKDSTSVTWKLRQGVKWSDGTPFSADDVAFTYQYQCDPATAASTFDRCDGLQSVVARDTNTVVVTYRSPHSYVFQWGVGADGAILQRDQYKSCLGVKATGCAADIKPIGTGPYKVRDFKISDVATFDLNENFRDPSKPFFKSVTFKGGTDPEAAARAIFQSGDIDYAWNLQVEATTLRTLAQNSQSGTLVTAFGSSVERLDLNFSNPDSSLGDKRAEPDTRHPFLSDKSVRRALAMATNRDAIAQKIYGDGLFGRATCNVLAAPDALSSSNTKGLDVCKFDVDAANAELDSAGWIKGADGIRAKGTMKLKVLFQTNVNARRELTQAMLKKDWESIGFQVDLRSEPFSTFFTNTSPGGAAHFWADVQTYADGGDPDPTAYLTAGWTTAQMAAKANNWLLGNRARYSNKDFDALVARLVGETDPTKRAQLAMQANDLLIQDVAVIPLVERAAVTSGVAKSLKGVDPSPWDSEMYNVADWTK